MKRTTITLTLNFIALFIFSLGGFAQSVTFQDTIYKVDQDIIVCRVLEVNTTEVKYQYEDRSNITLAIESELVNYIALSTGEILKPNNNSDEMADNAYGKQKSMNIKVGFLTPLQGYTDIGFEWSRKPLQSIEGSLGLIGLGKSNEDQGEVKGFSLSAGYKFYASPEFHLRNVRNAHRMGGLYVQPTLITSIYQREEEVYLYDANANTNYDKVVTSQVFKSAFLLKIGKQYIFSNIFSVDANFGIGYGSTNTKKIDWPENSESYKLIDLNPGYGFSVLGETNLAISSTLKIGILIK